MTTITDTTAPLIKALSEAFDLAPDTLAALRALNHADTLPALIDTDGDDIGDYLDWQQIAADSWDDDCGERVYQFGDRCFVHDSASSGTTAIFEADDIRDFLAGWDYDNYGCRENLLVAFGLDAEIPEAAPTHVGPVRVWCSPKYYHSTCNAPRPHWVTEDPEDAGSPVRTFDSYDEAAAWIAETEDAARSYKSDTDPRGSYVCAHGEYAAPDYTISPA